MLYIGRERHQSAYRAMHERRDRMMVRRARPPLTDKKLHVHTGEPIDQHHAAAGGRGGCTGINAGGHRDAPAAAQRNTITANGARMGRSLENHAGSHWPASRSPAGRPGDRRKSNSSLGTNALRTIAGSSSIRVTHAAHSLPENPPTSTGLDRLKRASGWQRPARPNAPNSRQSGRPGQKRNK